jgi:hypothetical protein
LAGLQASGQNVYTCRGLGGDRGGFQLAFQIVFQLVDENDPGRLPPGEDERRRWPPTRSRLVLAPSGLLFCVLYDGYDGTDTQDEIIVLDAQTPPRRCSLARYRFGLSLFNDARGMALFLRQGQRLHTSVVFSLAGEHLAPLDHRRVEATRSAVPRGRPPVPRRGKRRRRGCGR